MMLTRDAILREIEAGRLGIEPLTPTRSARLDRPDLGDEIRVMEGCASRVPVTDEVDYRDHTSPPLDVPFVLEPGETIHGITRERVTLRRTSAAWLEAGALRAARPHDPRDLGLRRAGRGEPPGARDVQRVERSLRIHAGVRLCQIVLQRREGTVYAAASHAKSSREPPLTPGLLGALGLFMIDGDEREAVAQHGAPGGAMSPFGTVHGGIARHLFDTALAVAIARQLGPDDRIATHHLTSPTRVHPRARAPLSLPRSRACADRRGRRGRVPARERSRSRRCGTFGLRRPGALAS